MRANLETSVKVGGGNKVVGTNRAWWFENANTQASMFQIAMYLATSKPSTPSLGLSLNVGPKTTSSILFESSQYQIDSLFNKKFSSKATIQFDHCYDNS
jgi:hypothetical protein